MNTKHLAIHVAAPTFYYLSIVLYFITGMTVLASTSKDMSFLILGFLLFMCAYNCWTFANRLRSDAENE